MCTPKTRRSSEWTEVSSPSVPPSPQLKVMRGDNDIELTEINIGPVANFSEITTVFNTDPEECPTQELSQPCKGSKKFGLYRARIKEIGGGAQWDPQGGILRSLIGVANAMIVDRMAARAEGADDWEVVGSPRSNSDAPPEDVTIELENSRSRLMNSALHYPNDIYVLLSVIKRPDGTVSGLFPKHLRELFSYCNEKLAKLLEEYGLNPHDEYGKNSSEVLDLIGVNRAFAMKSPVSQGESDGAYMRCEISASQGEGARNQNGVGFGHNRCSSSSEFSSPPGPYSANEVVVLSQ